MANDKPQAPKSKVQFVRRVWRFGARLDVAAVVVFVVLLLATLGSCFPQLSSPVADDPERLARWEATVRARYGALTDLLAAGGVFRWFRSPVFLGLLILLVSITLVCTLQRWLGVVRRVFRRPVRCSDVALDTAPRAARLSVLPEVHLPRIVREALKRRGFRVRSETVGDTVYLRGDRSRLAPLATLVTHLAVLLLLLGVALGSGWGWREEVTVGPGETIEVGHGSGLALRNEGFAIVRYPDESPANYEAEIAVIRGRREVARGGVRINEPLTYDGVSFVLRGYEEVESGYGLTLSVVHDPGYGLVVAAGFLLLLGPTVSFNFPHCWVHVRIERGGASCPDGRTNVRLAGRADRQAWDFGREFASLVEEICRSVIPLE